VIYLHLDASALMWIRFPGYANDSCAVKPGDAYQVMYGPGGLTGCSLHCDGCFVSVWHTSYGEVGGTYASDGAGAFYTGQRALGTRYVSFFDFGDATTLYVTTLRHRREAPLTGYFAAGGATARMADLRENVPGDNVSNPAEYGYNFNSPGILDIASTPHLVADIDITVGSKLAMPPEFSNARGWGTAGRVAVLDGAIARTACARGRDDAGLLVVAAEARVWAILSYVMCGLTGLLFILSTVALSAAVVSHCRDQRASALEREPLVAG